MRSPTPHEFLALWLQTGEEPSLPNNLYDPSFERQSLTELSQYVADMLFEATNMSSDWVNKVLSSRLSHVLQSSKAITFVPGEGKNHPFTHTLNKTLEHLLAYNLVREEATLALIDYIKNNLHFYKGKPDKVIKRSPMTSLLLTLSYIKSNNQEENEYPFGFNLVDRILPSCSGKQTFDALSLILSRSPSPYSIDFVLKKIKQHQITIPKDVDFYSEIIYQAVSGVKPMTPPHRQDVIKLLSHKKLRNKIIKSLIINREVLGNTPFFNMDQFCAMLPEQDLPDLLKTILGSPLNPKGLNPDRLPPFLKSVWERHQIQQGLEGSIFKKIKKVLFSSRPIHVPRTVSNEPSTEVKDVASSRPRKKM